MSELGHKRTFAPAAATRLWAHNRPSYPQATIEIACGRLTRNAFLLDGITQVMANLDFYALGDDLRSLFRFVYAETDVVIYELSSKFDCDARQFSSLAELEAAFNLDDHVTCCLQLWSPTIMVRPIIRRVELKIASHSFQYVVEGAGLLQLHLNGQRDGVVYHKAPKVLKSRQGKLARFEEPNGTLSANGSR